MCHFVLLYVEDERNENPKEAFAGIGSLIKGTLDLRESDEVS